VLKIEQIHEIIKLIDRSSITDFTYETNEENETMVSLKKSNGIEPKDDENEINSITKVEPQPNSVRESNNNETASNQYSSNANYEFKIVSPMVGTFYAASDPDSDVYVKEGSIVNEDTVVCVVEAMKLYHEIEAEATGKITKILVKNGELVEYGQPLFKVKSNEGM